MRRERMRRRRRSRRDRAAARTAAARLGRRSVSVTAWPRAASSRSVRSSSQAPAVSSRSIPAASITTAARPARSSARSRRSSPRGFGHEPIARGAQNQRSRLLGGNDRGGGRHAEPAEPDSLLMRYGPSPFQVRENPLSRNTEPPQPARGETSDGFQNAHPRDPRLPEAGHPVLRHLDAAGAPAGLARDDRAARRGGQAVSPGASRRDRIARLSGRGAAGLCARQRLRDGAQEGQIAGTRRSATPTISNTAPTRSRCRRTRSRRASASSCSTICSRPAARCRPPSSWCDSAGGTVAAAACIIELAFLQGREKLDVPLAAMISYDS